MKILVTGGAGYIGSHTVVELLGSGHEVVVVDDFSNSNQSALSGIETIAQKNIAFYKVDVRDQAALKEVFKAHKFDGVIHFAGFKAVGESVREPLKYYDNNLMSTISLLKCCQAFDVKRFIFSSSATVYGDQPSPLDESLALNKRTNPYGETKAMIERILEDVAQTDDKWKIALLRYFNPVGAHKSGLIGEVPKGVPNNLMPYITQTAKGLREKLFVYGKDYDTVDGTGVRDYIHVVDLARGHVLALEQIGSGCHPYNLGTGKGTSVLEMIEIFKRVNKVALPYEITSRRPGDIDVVYSTSKKAKEDFGFETSLTVEDMCRDAWNFEKNRD